MATLSSAAPSLGRCLRVFQEVELRSSRSCSALTGASRQLICFIYPTSWWFIRWQTLLSMTRDKRHSDSCLWLLIKSLPRTQWRGNFTPWSPTKCWWQRILTQVPGNIPIVMETRNCVWLMTRTLACFILDTRDLSVSRALYDLLIVYYKVLTMVSLVYHSVLLLVSLSRGRVSDCCSSSSLWPGYSHCPLPPLGPHRPDSTLGKLERAGREEK